MSFDWTKLEGYREDMTAEEKVALMENYEPETPAAPPSGPTVSKKRFDEVSSEVAKLKKQLQSNMTEAEKKEAARLEAEEEMKTELESLRREKTLNEHKASFLSQGYTEDLANKAATAMVDGNSADMFAAMKEYQASVEKNLRAKILKETPTPPAGDGKGDDQGEKELNQLRQWFGLPPEKK